MCVKKCPAKARDLLRAGAKEELQLGKCCRGAERTTTGQESPHDNSSLPNDVKGCESSQEQNHPPPMSSVVQIVHILLRTVDYFVP